MKKIVITTLLLLTFTSFSIPQEKPCLCEKGEENFFSFETTKSKKVMSLCIGPNESYIQYRFGLLGKIELQYPEKKDAASWKAFSYWGYHRGGGPQNAGLDIHRLTFSNGEATYEVYQNSGYDGDTEESFFENCGIRISNGNKKYDITGNVDNYSGHLRYNDKMLWEEDN